MQHDLIFTNENCTGCNRCISACVVEDANISLMENGKNKIHIDGQKCIKCGKCIEACPHDARDFLDDTDMFLEKLDRGAKVSLLVAPSARANFSDLPRLLGALKKMGVQSVYDTSFGADITTWAYLRYLQKSGKQGGISQPCPAVVNYIEMHEPALVSSLVPVHSPMMCAAIYMRKYAGVNGDIAFLSPCIAKHDEITDKNTGAMVQYNVTFSKLAKALKARGIDYRNAQPLSFDNPAHGLGSVYSMPGGLRVNVERHVPDAWVYQIEGQPKVKKFLNSYAQQPPAAKPLLVDILNCAEGCNIGTGAICKEEDNLRACGTMYELEKQANSVEKKLLKKGAYPGFALKEFDKTLKLDDFTRRYTDKLIPPVAVTQGQIEMAYAKMYKITPESRRVDCGSCGFSSCERMASAIAKGINHPENCVEYHKSELRKQQSEIQEMLQQRELLAEDLRSNAERIFGSVSTSSVQADQAAVQIASINEELEAVEEIAARLGDVVETLASHVAKYADMGSQIVSISTQTQMLAINAAVEAAHAGEVGKGFAVVAEEMKNLSDKSGKSAKEMLDGNETVFPILEEVRSFSRTLNERTQSIASSTKEMQRAVEEISKTEREIEIVASEIVQ